MKPYHTWIILWQKILGVHYYNTLKWYWTWKSKYWNYSEPLQISLRNCRVQSRCFAYVTHNASTEYSTPSPKRSIFADLCNNTCIMRVFYFLIIRTYFNVWYFIICVWSSPVIHNDVLCVCLSAVHNRKPCHNGWTGWGAVWDMLSQVGPRNSALGWGSDPSRRSGIWGASPGLCKYWILILAFFSETGN